MHLWAAGNSELVDKKKPSTVILNKDGKKLAGVILNSVQSRLVHIREDHPLRCAANGLAKLGYRVEICTDDEWPCFSKKPELIAVWNGLREPLASRVKSAEREGIKVYRIEHGYFNRKIYHQCDPQGILHWSTLSKRLKTDPPAAYQSRFEAIYSRPVVPVKVRNNRDYILVIGQTPSDTQLSDSEIQGPLQLDKAVCRAIEGLDIKAVFRPQPGDHAYKDRRKYLPLCPHESLDEALNHARFIITINSNTGVEPLAAGVPVLCFGPCYLCPSRDCNGKRLYTIYGFISRTCNILRPIKMR
jgi:hypothetical protein